MLANVALSVPSPPVPSPMPPLPSSSTPTTPLPLTSITGSLFRARVHAPSRGQFTEGLDYALDTVREVRDEIHPQDQVVNLVKREARPVVMTDTTPIQASETDKLNGSRFHYPWTLNPLFGLSGEPYALREHAFQQLLTRFRFRKDHLERFPAGYQHKMVNHLIQQGGEDQPAFLRLAKGNQVRAMMTEAFTPFDDLELLENLFSVLSERTDITSTAKLAWMDVQETCSHFRIVWGEETALKVGDTVKRGIHITNSEVGMRAVRIEAVVIRLICLNGLLAPSVKGSQVFRHVGNPARLKAGIREAVEDASLETERVIADFRRSLQIPIPKPTEFLTGVIKAEPFLSQDDLKATLLAWETSGAEETLFGVTNALTFAAQTRDAEKRYAMETVAGRVLEEGVR